MKLLSFAVVISLMLVSVASAQTAPGVAAAVPFEFFAGGKWMPAGDYVLYKYGKSGTLVLRDAKFGSWIMLGTNKFSPEGGLNPAAKLVFRRYEDAYFLSQVWDPSDAGYEVPQSPTENEWVRAGRSQKTATVLARVIR